ncbi:MAG: GIY-YIG nuclease family protein [Candidatus Levybacteria bacterium]|nr:GIY-YIG nuclease family protein [Candidatus Levybacteria bacterium]
MKHYFVYLEINPQNTVIYVGVTNDLVRRMYEHKEKLVEVFTKKYHVSKLVYFETFEDIQEAIKREKQIKGGSRKKKIALIEKENPLYEDLYEKIV